MKRQQNYEPFKIRGRWRVTALYKGTDKVYKILEGDNLIVMAGKELVGYLLQNKVGYTKGLTYHAIGTDVTEPTESHTTLTAEANRKAITAKTQTPAPNNNEFVWSTFYAAGECTHDIKEAGVFGHDASLILDSGVLFSHYLVSFDNSDGIFDLIFDYILTIGYIG